jgi:hypothetical protein
MAEKFVSPGVFTQENDLSFLPQGIAEIGTAVVGTFSKGPAFVPTTVSSIEQFREVFGGENEKYYASYAVRNVLQNSNTITVVRVGELGGYSHTGIRLTVATGSVTSSVFLAPSNEGTTINIGTFNTSSDGSVVHLSGSGIGIVTASFNPLSESYFTKVFGTNPLGTKGAYVYSHFQTTNSESFQTITGGSGFALSSGSVSLDFDGGNNDEPVGGSTSWITSQNVNGNIYDIFKLHRLSTGADTNTDVKISIQNVKRPSETGGTYGVFDVLVRALNDTDLRPNVLEVFNACTLDPASANYVSRKIGDRYITVDSSGNLTTNGTYENKSQYIRVEMASNSDALPTTVVPGGFRGYVKPFANALVPDLPLLSAGGDVTGSSKTHFGINFDGSTNWAHYLAPLDDNISASTTSSAFSLPSDMFETSATSSTFQVNRRFTLGFQGGFDAGTPNKPKEVGTQVTDASNVGGLDLTNSASSGSVAFIKALNAISNPLEFDYNVLVTPGVTQTYGSSVVSRAKEIVEDRADAFYIADLGWLDDSIDTVVGYAATYDSSYMGTYYSWVQIIDQTTNKPLWVPPSVVMSGVYAFNDSVAAEWFAPAGLNRGGITEAINLYKRLKREDMDKLYNGKVNPIVSFPGQGIVAYGQKTLQVRASALDRINVRRLLINLKKFISSSSRFLVFEQNTTETRDNFLALVNPYLDGVQQRQGLFAYRVVVDETVNTPEVIDRNQLVGKIFIQPARAAEFIVLDFNVLPTGAEFPQ